MIKNCFKKLLITYLHINIIIYVLAVCLSVICVSILKERVEKTDELKARYTQLETKYSVIINEKERQCVSTKTIDIEKCSAFQKANSDLSNILQQITMIQNIENRGSAKSICGSISSITSGEPGFEKVCYEKEKQKNLKEAISLNITPTLNSLIPEEISRSEIIYFDIKDKFGYLFFERLPSEILYLILAMTSSIIGSAYKLKVERKKIYDLTMPDIIASLSQGFIAYIIVMGAKYFVVLGNQQFVTNVNPYSIALVGCLSGMCFDTVFNIVSKDRRKVSPI